MNRSVFKKLPLVILAALVIWGCATDSAGKEPANDGHDAPTPSSSGGDYTQLSPCDL